MRSHCFPLSKRRKVFEGHVIVLVERSFDRAFIELRDEILLLLLIKFLDHVRPGVFIPLREKYEHVIHELDCTPGSSGTVNWYVLYSPRFITMTPRVSSSSSRRAVRIGFVISRLLPTRDKDPILEAPVTHD